MSTDLVAPMSPATPSEVAAPTQAATPAAAQPAAPPAAPAAPQPLSEGERRALGVLIEKAKTTPDSYPMSLNSIVTACNQKTNRDPVTNFSDVEVEDYLTGLQRKGLVIKTITGTGRVSRWRHEAYSAWQVNKVELAILGELLLRGPQTEGELRTRASRMEPIDDLESLRAVLQTLVQRGLVVYLTPPGRRGTILTHGLYEAAELEQLKSRAPVAAGHGEDHDGSVGASAAASSRGTVALHQEIAALRVAVTELQAGMAALAERVRKLEGPDGG